MQTSISYVKVMYLVCVFFLFDNLFRLSHKDFNLQLSSNTFQFLGWRLKKIWKSKY